MVSLVSRAWSISIIKNHLPTFVLRVRPASDVLEESKPYYLVLESRFVWLLESGLISGAWAPHEWCRVGEAADTPGGNVEVPFRTLVLWQALL